MSLVRPTGTGLIRPTGTGLIRPANVGLVRTASGTAPPLPYLTTVLADSPAAYWKLDETSGTSFADTSGSGLTLAGFGTFTVNQAPLINLGKSVVTSGGGGFIQKLTSSAVLNANGKITLEAWVKCNAVGGQIICSDDTSGSRYFQYSVGSNVLTVILFDSGGATHTRAGSVVINDNVRHHVVATYDGATIRTYVDGVEDGSGTADVFTLATTNSYVQLFARHSSGADTALLIGTLDECAIYTTALSAARIAAHFAAGIA